MNKIQQVLEENEKEFEDNIRQLLRDYIHNEQLISDRTSGKAHKGTIEWSETALDIIKRYGTPIPSSHSSQLRLIEAFKEMIENANNFRNSKVDMNGYDRWNDAMEQSACKLDAIVRDISELEKAVITEQAPKENKER
jgi:hypothetical protein